MDDYDGALKFPKKKKIKTHGTILFCTSFVIFVKIVS